jgi:polyether ionophore transport system permease protein
MTDTVHRGTHNLSQTSGRGARGAGAGSTAREVAPRTLRGSHPRRTVLRLYTRLIRRGALLMAAGIAAYAGFEVASYSAAYPNGVSATQFAMFQDNPAVRIMQGVPNSLDSAGGFTVWDGGWFFQLILAVWALLTTSRLLRGEEDVERTDLVLAGPVRATRATALALVGVGAAALLIGVVVTITMLAFGTGLPGSALLGLGLAGVTATFAAVAAVACQLVDVRRRAAALAAGVLGLAYVLRMVGNSTDARSWVRWATPLGWMDELQPYGDPDLRVLVPILIVPVLLAALALVLRARRDLGGALLATDAGREPHLHLLGSPIAFAWRSNRAVLLGWILGLGAYAAVMGSLISTMIDWLAQDKSYQQIMADSASIKC